jgi:deoxyuridine 5'-triphosphate nucleotidohydrolase
VIKTLSAKIMRPTRATTGSAGHDIYAPSDVTVPAKGAVKFKSGITVDIPSSMAVSLRSRSGMAWNHDVYCFNGLIDSDYSGKEIGVKLINLGDNDYEIKKGERVAQLVIHPVFMDETTEILELSRAGGFGSSGK